MPLPPAAFADGNAHVRASRLADALLEVVTTRPEGERLLKLRNPWGQTEWEGKWSDADMARAENARMRRKLNWSKGDDGVFWMGYDDFVQYFNSISVCMLPTGWQSAVAHGEWAGQSAGGCPNYDSVSSNPQFLLSISRPVNVVLTLTQGDRRVGADTDQWAHATIGMYVCYASSRMRSRNEVHRRKVTSTGTFHCAREATIKCSLEMKDHGKTEFVILPCTFDPGVEAKFTVRAFVPEGEPEVQLRCLQ